MIKKPRKPSLELLTFLALAPRFPKHLPQYNYFERDLGKMQSGFIGERSVDYYLQLYARSHTNYLYHNLRFLTHESAYQMDTLLLTPFYILIIEIKNWGGVSLEFNQHQVKQIFQDGRIEIHDDPIIQVKRQRTNLMNLLEKLSFSHLPVEYLTVIANRNPELIFKDYPESDRIIRSSYLDFSILDFDKEHSVKILSPNQLSKINNTFLSTHKEKKINILDKYNLTADSITKGVLCPSCLTISMIRQKKSWLCIKCKYRNNSKSELLKALAQYSMLIGPSITHQQFKDFFQISTARHVSSLLGNLNLPSEGKTRGKKYRLDQLMTDMWI
ncbi:NERD domain-containing protein [Bacillus sp. H-16]|uniref:nuclease-related domain-containing protein n=1 Tax=Alteribacter salitolerans TaxID=2912333 RepID=UPI0019643830|nr:nuclease-related domain-containing protein [Alteribacter salitolerans]MBM7095643.1 NERD domain-containing protein [Alteribacter salitolerans]